MKTSLSHRMTKTDRQADTDEGTDRRENCQTLRKRAHCNTNNLCNMCMPFYYMALPHKDWELPNSRI